MAKGYDTKRSRGEIKEVQESLEKKKSELSGLERNKQGLMDAMNSVLGAELDEKTKEIVHQAIDDALEKNKEQGENLNDEMNEGFSRLEEVIQETDGSRQSAINEKKSLEGKQKIVERFGIGNSLEKGINELDNNISELESISDEARDVMKELSSVAQKLGML